MNIFDIDTAPPEEKTKYEILFLVFYFGKELVTSVVPIILIIDTQFIKIFSFDMVKRFENN